MRFCICTASLAAVLLSAIVLAGCGGSDPGTLSRKTLVGTWREDPALLQARPGSPILVTTAPIRRQLMLSADRTFRLFVCDPDGVPMEPAEFATGTWRLTGDTVLFETRQVELAPEHARWVPERLLAWRPGPAGQPDVIELRGPDGRRVAYGRVASPREK